MTKHNPRSKFGPEDGVAILLAVMIVSAIAVITVTVAFFVVQEIRNARSTSFTESAYLAAESGAEHGLYEAKRGTFTQPCSSAQYYALGGYDVAGSIKYKRCLSTLPATFNVTAANPLVFLLYDPLNINTNTCLEDLNAGPCSPTGLGAGSQLYTSLVVTHVSGSNNVTVDIDTVDGLNYKNGTVTPGNVGNYSIDADILGANDERLRVTITPTSGSVTINVATTGMYTGLPDYQTVDAEGCVAITNLVDCDEDVESYKRRINVTLPR